MDEKKNLRIVIAAVAAALISGGRFKFKAHRKMAEVYRLI